jgi:chitin disaccharide deacetylase
MKNLLGMLFIIGLVLVTSNCAVMAQADKTYAEKLGWPKGAKVVIFHVDDAGMSYSSNRGAIRSIEEGVATSTSIMMPCPWAASFTKYVLKNPSVDAGLHLTLTSEWQDYRWPPLNGISHSPGLVDEEGCMWHEVEQVVKHASADIIETEIRAQVERSLKLGLRPTHLDSHMGTLFAHIPYLERYIKVGIEYGIPVMFPGGNNKLLYAAKPPVATTRQQTKEIGEMLWKAGLPVLDDLHTNSGDWKIKEGSPTPAQWGKYKAKKWIEALGNMEPGVAMLIVHSSDITEEFKQISGSGGSRYADLLSMMDPDLKAYIKSQGIILTTWRELLERRKNVK